MRSALPKLPVRDARYSVMTETLQLNGEIIGVGHSFLHVMRKSTETGSFHNFNPQSRFTMDALHILQYRDMGWWYLTCHLGIDRLRFMRVYELLFDGALDHSYTVE